MAKKQGKPAALPVPIDEDAAYLVTEVDADDLITSHHVCRGLTAARTRALAICEECFGPLSARKRREVREALATGQYLENRTNGGSAVNIDVLDDPSRHYSLAVLTCEELATVLAGLRAWQQTRRAFPTELLEIASDGGKFVPLNSRAVDALCERLNCGGHDAAG